MPGSSGLDSVALKLYSRLTMNIVVKGDTQMATLVRWEPFRELAALQSEMSRFMNGLVDGNGRAAQSWIPTADVWETEKAVVYAFDLPGIPEDRISIELDDG